MLDINVVAYSPFSFLTISVFCQHNSTHTKEGYNQPETKHLAVQIL